MLYLLQKIVYIDFIITALFQSGKINQYIYEIKTAPLTPSVRYEVSINGGLIYEIDSVFQSLSQVFFNV